ncbi:MAG: molybdopterin-dependent oxidoreductase, partial [Xanthobacteraceae bacterium]|nr:molybdopterin-dependent oxidoreductase [Xanthobacteraceae bacterium]
NDEVNEEWISDKARHVVDGLRVQRLDQPYVRLGGRLEPASWSDAFRAIAAKVASTRPAAIGAIAGDLCGVEEMFALKELIARLGSPNLDCRQDGTVLDPKWGRASYLFNATVAGIDEADGVMIIGSNPRKEAPVLNARIRKRWRHSNLKIGVIGERADLTYDYAYLGAGTDTLASFLDHKPTDLKRQIWIVGQGALARPDGLAVLSGVAKAAVSTGALVDGWNGFSVLHTAAARVGGLDIGFVPGANGLVAAAMAQGGVDLLFLLGADEIEVEPGPFVVYIGTHGDRGAQRADVILPGAAYTEKAATYVNTEGRVQRAGRAAFPPGDAREDWSILRALSDVLGHRLPYDSLRELRTALFRAHPHLATADVVVPGSADEVRALARIGGSFDKAPFKSPVEDFYLTNPVARASAVMAECSALAETAAEAAE